MASVSKNEKSVFFVKKSSKKPSYSQIWHFEAIKANQTALRFVFINQIQNWDLIDNNNFTNLDVDMNLMDIGFILRESYIRNSGATNNFVNEFKKKLTMILFFD